MAGIGLDDKSDEGTQETTKIRWEWATVARKHMQTEWENVGCGCLLFSKAGLGIYSLSPPLHQYNVRYAGRKRDGGKRGSKVENKGPAGDGSRGVVCERRSGIQKKAASVLYVKVRQQARGRKERRWSKSDGKGGKREAKEKSDESKIKIER